MNFMDILHFMNKTPSKEIMTRTRLRNKFLKEKSEKNKNKCSKHCVSLLRKFNSNYFGNFSEKNIICNKIFWKTIKPFLSVKVTSINKMKQEKSWTSSLID